MEKYIYTAIGLKVKKDCKMIIYNIWRQKAIGRLINSDKNECGVFVSTLRRKKVLRTRFTTTIDMLKFDIIHLIERGTKFHW